MKRCLIAMCFSALAVSAVLARDVNYAAYVRDNAESQDPRSDMIAKVVTRVVTDPQSVDNSLPPIIG